MMTYITIKQILWLREPLGSADVARAVQAEWARRWTSDTTMTALSVKQNNKKDDNIKTRNRIYEQHKAHGHTTAASGAILLVV